jgi:hypothetical protein
MSNPQELPPEANALIAKIEAHLREARPLLQTSAQDADIFAIRETERRYLPETIELFLAVPLSLRQAPNEQGESAQAQLLKSLAILENATYAHLQNLASAQRDAAMVNQQFLAERFSGVPTEPHEAIISPVPDAALAMPPSNYFLQTLFQQANQEAAGNQQQLLDAIATKFTEAFPRLTRVDKQLFSRAAKRVQIEVPSSQAALRYVLSATPYGFEASIATVVRGIALKTETAAIERWMASIIEHLADFSSQNQETQARLKELFGR